MLRVVFDVLFHLAIELPIVSGTVLTGERPMTKTYVNNPQMYLSPSLCGRCVMESGGYVAQLRVEMT